MATERVVASLVRVASEDLAGARILATHSNRNAVYLLSQAAEKLVKAVLTSEGIHGGIGHQLRPLVDKIPESNPVKQLLRKIEKLEAFSTTFRYPTQGGRVKPIPSQQDFGIWSADVEVALKRVTDEFQIDLKGSGPAGRADPIR